MDSNEEKRPKNPEEMSEKEMDEAIKEILSPSAKNNQPTNLQNSEKAKNDENSKESSSSGSSLDSIISCHSSEYSELTAEHFQTASTVTDSSDTSSSEDECLSIRLEEDPSRIPKFDINGKRIKEGRNFQDRAVTRYADKVPASKVMRDLHMRAAGISDENLPNYNSEEHSDKRKKLTDEGIDFVYNQFGEVIPLSQISETELKIIIGKKYKI